MGKKVLIIGGVAGGMSCATRIKRLDDSIEVTVLEKGPNVSFANCGMPYYIGGVITDRANMLVASPAMLSARYGLDVRTLHEAVAINREARTVTVKSYTTGQTTEEHYDQLVLSPGAESLIPPIPTAEGANVFVLSQLDDMDKIAAAAERSRTACVVGAGFIGLELAENLTARGLEVTVVELTGQVMPPLDAEMAAPLLQELRLHGVSVRLNNAVERIEGDKVVLRDGGSVNADFVCLCAGVRPRSELAKSAGLVLGGRGHIVVDRQMRTSDPNIFAVGDAVETVDSISGAPLAVPLAGPANRQGRVAADVICGRDGHYPGIQGSSIVKVFNLAAAQTGWSEKRLKASGIPYQRVYAHPMHHVRYYPGAQPLGMKLLFKPDGEILGAQVVGGDGVETAIDVLATAIRGRLGVFDLEELELAYSPQWGAAKSGVNMLGFVAANLLRGDYAATPEAQDVEALWLDVRTPEEVQAGSVPGSVNISVDALRRRMSELPRDRDIVVYCAVGLRGYIAVRMLQQAGFRATNYSGGYRTWSWFRMAAHPETIPEKRTTDGPPEAEKATPGKSNSERKEVTMKSLDVCGLQCPGPITRVKQEMESLAEGDLLRVVSSDPGFAADIPAWCARTGNILVEVTPEPGGKYVACIQRGSAGAAPVTGACCDTAPSAAKQRKTIICFSGDLDRVMAAFVIANGALAMGDPVTIFFTFWGLNALRKEDPPAVKKGFMDRMFGMMMPKGVRRLKLSKMNMGGMGTAMMKRVMKDKKVMSLDELIQAAQASGAQLVACAMSMDVMGLHQDELIDGVEIGGVGAFLGAANESNTTLFI